MWQIDCMTFKNTWIYYCKCHRHRHGQEMSVLVQRHVWQSFCIVFFRQPLLKYEKWQRINRLTWKYSDKMLQFMAERNTAIQFMQFNKCKTMLLTFASAAHYSTCSIAKYVTCIYSAAVLEICNIIGASYFWKYPPMMIHVHEFTSRMLCTYK